MTTLRLENWRAIVREADGLALEATGHLELALDETFVSPPTAASADVRVRLEGLDRALYDLRGCLETLRRQLAKAANEPGEPPSRAVSCRPAEGFAYDSVTEHGDYRWRCRGCGGVVWTINGDVPEDHTRIVKGEAP